MYLLGKTPPAPSVSMGLYNDKDSINNLGARRAMMHSIVMADCLWEMIKVEQDWVGLVVSGTTLSLLTTSLRVIIWNES